MVLIAPDLTKTNTLYVLTVHMYIFSVVTSNRNKLIS